MRREYFRIPPEMRKDSNMQHILVHDNLVVFWIFIQFQLRQSNFIVACDFLIFADIWVLFMNAITYTYGKFAYRGACKQNKFWLAILLNVNQSKKWAADVP